MYHCFDNNSIFTQSGQIVATALLRQKYCGHNTATALQAQKSIVSCAQNHAVNKARNLKATENYCYS